MSMIRRAEEMLQEVRDKMRGGKGKVEIEYYSEDDLGRILDIILGIA